MGEVKRVEKKREKKRGGDYFGNALHGFGDHIALDGKKGQLRTKCCTSQVLKGNIN
jgi:hypothetical protein